MKYLSGSALISQQDGSCLPPRRQWVILFTIQDDLFVLRTIGAQRAFRITKQEILSFRREEIRRKKIGLAPEELFTYISNSWAQASQIVLNSPFNF